MNNYYLTSQLVADHQAALAADATHRAQLRDARAARKASAASAHQPGRGRLFFGRVFFGRTAHAAA
jgi:hypothetical protein